MEFKIMYFKRARKRGFTFMEVMLASSIFGIASIALMSVYLFSTRSFATIANYAELDQMNRNAMDTLTRELRAARMITSLTTNNGLINGMTIINNEGASVT